MGVSDYELLVELAAKGLAQRDSRPMPRSVTTPEGFYDVMARAALDAIGLRDLLEDRARAVPTPGLSADEKACWDEDANPPTMLLNDPNVTPRFELSLPTLDGDSANGTETQIVRGTEKNQSATCSRSRWAVNAQGRLALVTAVVERLRNVFGDEPEVRSDAYAEVASDVLSACNALSDWLHCTQVPKGLARAEAELGAVVGVYGNVAVVFGSLSGAEADQRQARLKACSRLLAQGDRHVEIFVGIVTKKLGGVTT